MRGEKAPGMRGGIGGDLFGGAGGDDLPTLVAAFRAEVNHPVGGLDDIQVVFDDDDGVAVIAQPVQDQQQLFDVVEVQAGGGFIEDVQRVAGIALGQFARKLHPLCLAAGERGGVLAQADVREADLQQGLELAPDHGNGSEELQRILHGHIQRLVDGLAFVQDLERLPVVTLAMADVTGHVNVR